MYISIVLGIAVDIPYSKRNFKPFCEQDSYNRNIDYAKVFNAFKFITTKE